MVQRVYYGEVTNEKNLKLPDLSPREWAVIVPVVAMAIFMGIAPNVFLRPTAAALEKAVQRMEQSRTQNVERSAPSDAAPAALTASGR
jgi:NADH-quinone oxidoreductase subunit M